MRLLILCLGAAVILNGTISAQESKLPPLPEGPLLKRTPDFSTWSVTVENSVQPKESGTTSDGDGQSSDHKKPPVVARSTVVKTAPTILEVNFDKQGKQTEIWHYRSIRVVKIPGAPTPMVLGGLGAAADIYTLDFSRSDFAGLDWISANAYAGMAACDGKQCIVFKATISPLAFSAKQEEEAAIKEARALGQAPPQKQMVPATAYIDLETRLPLLVTFGAEKRTYQYGAPPSAPLQLPPELQNVVKEYAQRIQRLAAPPSRPF